MISENRQMNNRTSVSSLAAGICLEDKGFPKMNSFVGNRHPLADVAEFSGGSMP
jgi:2-methylisocitrate lyase-like PEP mutase family enzyme